MPTPDTNGLPPFADFEMVKAKLNELVNKYNTLLVNLDSLNVVSLTADHIDAGTIDANLVRIRSDLTAGAYIEIDGNGMVINNGSFDTFTADINGQVTMTRALIQSSPGGFPRIVMDPDNQLFAAYSSATSFAALTYNGEMGYPALDIRNSSDVINIGFNNSMLANSGIYSSNSFEVRSLGSIYLSSSDIRMTGWNNLKNFDGDSLQDELNSIQTQFSNMQTQINGKLSGNGEFGTFYVSSTPGGPADLSIGVSNGLVSM